MSQFDFLAGTDAALIGLWDRKYSNTIIREKSLFKFLKRLPLDAEEKKVFYIETGADGESSVRILVDEKLPSNDRYKKIASGYGVEIESGEAIFDGLESYGSEYQYKNIFPIQGGTYSIDLYELKDPELEDSAITQIGSHRKPHLMERFAFIALILMVISVYLLFKNNYLFGGALFSACLFYSLVLGKIQEKEKKNNPVNYEINVNIPYLIVELNRTSDLNIKGGHISLV